MRRSRTPRVARGAVVASVATFTALVSHVVAGGSVPGPFGIVAPWMLALMVSTLLAGRTLSAVRLGLSVVASQLLFHTLFVMGAPVSGAAPAISHHDHGAMAMSADAVTTTSASALVSALCADPLMWALHAAAALVTTAALYRGERTVRALLQLARDIRAWARRAVARARTVIARPVPAARAADAVAWRVRPAAHVVDGRRRGPPLAPAL